ncbi:hypothetical protein TRFO_03380 [Tritrichomonas foetus]|uniref:Uncharacterized protein n=1 Tax=Tritrichomonas foetus TaxID=1144522 RepID=A0A1J4KQM9_9EUKA|nr:hypothetical protein TRFO_03380 [Tritrichomonas foetus]|eukprot:OHT13607.1 hypothetical protein TRFO_03380 [Tritrichomonas foetus]
MKKQGTPTRRKAAAPLKFVKGGENLDVANSILRAEMPNKKASVQKKHKATAARSSLRRSASIERIFDKKKVEEKQSNVNHLRQQLSELKQKEKILAEKTKQQQQQPVATKQPAHQPTHQPIQQPVKQPINEPVKQPINEPVQQEIVAPPPQEALPPPPPPPPPPAAKCLPPKPANALPRPIPAASKTFNILEIRQSLRKVNSEATFAPPPIPMDRETSFIDVINQTMADRRNAFAPESDDDCWDDSESSDYSEETEF